MKKKKASISLEIKAFFNCFFFQRAVRTVIVPAAYNIFAVRTVIVPAAYNIFLISNLCVT